MYKKNVLRGASTIPILFAAILIFSLGDCALKSKTEILWDKWGVPHIYSENTQGLFYAFGWAQMHCHADAILKAYGESRGRAAEYWGEPYLRTDRIVHQIGIPERSIAWFSVQSPEVKSSIRAFVQSMNDYAEAHSENIGEDARVVLPVTEYDIMSHLQYIWHVIFIGGRNFFDAQQWARAGSNAWAIGPSRSASGNALLLSNPHLNWGGYLMWFESHLVGPDVNFYGASILGMPFQIMGFNSHLGWTDTVNTMDGVDLFELALADGGYRWDGAVREFTNETVNLKIKQKDGSLRKEPLEIKRSIHGPVLAERGDRAIAVRIAGLDQPHMIEQVWAMKRSQNLTEFESALSRLQIPMLNFLYADQNGHILYVFGGQTPRRSGGDWSHWSRIVPGHSSANLWIETHSYEELPRVIDPPSGWLQNTNDPPWYCTFPPQLNPDDYPAYMAPQGMHLRAQRSSKLLMSDEQITFDELLEYKMSTRVEMADRLLNDLIPAARKLGGESLREAADLLETWDRKTDAQSRGAVLFNAWVNTMGAEIFKVRWNPENPLDTPDGLGNPAAAVSALEEAVGILRDEFGAIDVPWGDIFRLRYMDKDLPANGGFGRLGIFSVLTFVPDPDRKFRPRHGEGYIAAIEFGNPVRAKVLLTYGNATQSHSKHRGDQLELFVNKEFRPAWLSRKEIESNLERRESFDISQIEKPSTDSK
jgi:acyl-homoserine-lactone acylase